MIYLIFQHKGCPLNTTSIRFATRTSSNGLTNPKSRANRSVRCLAVPYDFVETTVATSFALVKKIPGSEGLAEPKLSDTLVSVALGSITSRCV